MRIENFFNRIELKNIGVKFGERLLFRSGCINIESGGMYPLLGLNGAGKTTLLRVLAGVVEPSEGEFSLRGSVLYQPQKPVVFNTTVLQNAIVGMKRPDKTMVLSRLDEVGLTGFAYKKAKTLSGGEVQRLCLCRSLLTGGDILLLDEPFSAIDYKSSGGLEEYLKDYCIRNGTTLVMAAHSLQTAERFSDKCLFIRDEELVLCGVEQAKGLILGVV